MGLASLIPIKCAWPVYLVKMKAFIPYMKLHWMCVYAIMFVCVPCRFRARHGAPTLSWDAKLAAAAQTWADSCPWGHSDSEYGENMAWGYRSFAAVVDAWYNEVRGLYLADLRSTMSSL